MPDCTADAADRRWDARIARARQLAAEHPASGEVLTFYAALAEYQKSLLEKGDSPHFRGVERKWGLSLFSGGVPFFEALDLEPVLAAIPDFLSWLRRGAPARLAEAAGDMRGLDEADWRELVDSYLAHAVDDEDETRLFVVETVLQPFAEEFAIARRDDPNPEPRIQSSESRVRCPICGGRPVVGVLREAGHGAKRTLVCGLCLIEQNYLRVVCPACGEQRFDALPVYTADQFAHVRIEACESCRTYLKTIDMAKDGLAVPLVDDLASVSLDLWAREQGYVRLRPHLLRV